MGPMRDPQREKQLTYEKQRRNHYGENDKASRKNLPRRRARTHRSFRRRMRQALVATSGHGWSTDSAWDRVVTIRREEFKKSPDIPLRDHIECQLEQRRRTGQNPPRPAD